MAGNTLRKPQANAAGRAPARAARPFFGLLDAITVPPHPAMSFDTAVAADHVASIWTWVVRDLAPDLIATDAADGPASGEALLTHVPELISRVREATSRVAGNDDEVRRFNAQMGGEEPAARLGIVLNALKCHALLGKAQSFGRAVNSMTDEAMLAPALQAMPLADNAVTALLMQATVGQVLNPSVLVNAAIRIAGSADETALVRAGFGPLLDAILSHSQAQIPAMGQIGTFADIDLTCRAVDRFHRLMRAIVTFVEMGRSSRHALASGAIIKTASDLIEPRLRDVAPDVNKSLRRAREGADRLDTDQILAALNGCYLLAAVRDCRDSLALNAAFEETWTRVGEAVEMHSRRNLDLVRGNPRDTIAAARLEGAIKMAELRFNAEYADVLRRARDHGDRKV